MSSRNSPGIEHLTKSSNISNRSEHDSTCLETRKALGEGGDRLRLLRLRRFGKVVAQVKSVEGNDLRSNLVIKVLPIEENMIQTLSRRGGDRR